MRIIACVLVIGCGAAPAPLAPERDLEVQPTKREAEALPDPVAPIDPMLGLAPPTSDQAVSWVSPGQARLEIAAVPIETAPANAPPIAVSILDAQGSLVRLAVRLEHARFSLWMDRAHLYGVITREQRVRVGTSPRDAQPTLYAGARVKRLARKDGFTHVRYVGALEIEGWVPSDAVGERGMSRTGGRIPTGRKTLTLLPGSIIRAAPNWNGAQLALAANSYFVDAIRDVDAKWTEVQYADGDVSVRGFYQRFSPPGRTHRERVDPDSAPVPIAPNARVTAGTCLYARASGEPIGYIVGDRDVALDATTNGWWTLAIDTPWGPITFAARGPTVADLERCQPIAP